MAKKTKTHQLRHIVAVSNYKGGIGKTATVMNLAAAIALRIEGYRVLVIDIDSSCSLTNLLGWQSERELQGEPTLYTALTNPAQGMPVYQTSRPNLYLCPASVNLSAIEALLNMRANANTGLKEIFGRPLDIRVPEGDGLYADSGQSTTLSDTFDYVFIDCQPSTSRMNYNALYAADGCIVPTELEAESIEKMAKLSVAVGNVAKETGNLSVHGVLISNYVSTLRTTKFYEPQIRQTFKNTFKTVIRNSKDITESRALHEDVFASYVGGRAAEDYAALASEYLDKFGK